MLYAAEFEHAAQKLRDLYRRGSDKHGALGLDQTDDLVDDGIVLLAFGLVDQILAVVAYDGAVGRDDHDVEFVYVPELRCLGLGRTGHTGQLVVHTEVVLQRYGCEGLRGGLDLDTLLGLDGLMQAVRIAAPVEDTSRLLVDDLHLVVHDHILHVALEHRVGLEQLVDRMHTLRLDRVVVDDLILALGLLLGRDVALLQIGDLAADVGQHEESVLVEVLRQHVVSLVGELYRVELLVDDEVEVVDDLGHAAVVVLHVYVLGLLELGLDTRLREELDQRLVFGQTLVCTVEQNASLVEFALGKETARLGHKRRDQILLQVVEVLDRGTVCLEELVVTLGYGTRYDKRRTRIVDQHRVDLVDNGVVVLALYEILGRRSHIVAQVVEAVLVVCTEGDVGHICLAARF